MGQAVTPFSWKQEGDPFLYTRDRTSHHPPRDVQCSSPEPALESHTEESGHCYPACSPFHQPTGPALFLDNAHREITVTTWKKRKLNPDPCTRLGTSYYSSCHWDKGCRSHRTGPRPSPGSVRRGMETCLARLVPACMGKGLWEGNEFSGFSFFLSFPHLQPKMERNYLELKQAMLLHLQSTHQYTSRKRQTHFCWYRSDAAVC